MKKRRLSVFLALCMLLTCFSSISFAQDANWNNGAKINFVPYAGQGIFKMSNWFESNSQVMDLEAYEDLTEYASRWNVFAGVLRTYQAYLKDNGYSSLSANGATLTQFEDASSLVPVAQTEAKVMVGIGLLSGSYNEDGKLYMNMSQNIKRSEVAKILAVFYQKINPTEPFVNYVGFDDVVGHWSEEYVRYAYERGLVNGKDYRNYDPEGYITKEEAIQILINMEDKSYVDGIEMKNIAKAVNETYYCTTRYDLQNGNTNSSSSISTSNKAITPSEYSYTIRTGEEVRITIKYASNRHLQTTATNDNCTISSKTSSSGVANLTVRGRYQGTSFIRCSYTDGNGYEDLYIPIFVKNNYSTSQITQINVSNSNISLRAGEIYNIANDVSVRQYNTAYRELYYASSDPRVAAVNYMTGNITAMGKGTCYIYIIADGTTKRVKVTVTSTNTGYPNYPNYPDNQYGEFGLYETYSTLYVGETLNLKNKMYNSTRYSVSYSTSDRTVATVSSAGTVTAKGVGTAYITLTCNGRKAVYTVNVTKNWYYPDYQVLDILFDSDNRTTISVGESYYLDDIVEVYPYNADKDSLRYRSLDTSIATVGKKNGIVKGVSRGSATIEVSADNVIRYFYVYVDTSSIAVTDISISKNTLDLNVGQTYMLANDVQVLPSNATEKTVFYSSSDQNVVLVSTLSGEVTAVREGTAKITVEAGGIKRYVNVNVKNGTDITPDPSKGDISFTITNTIDLAVDQHFNVYAILAGDTSGVTFSFSTDGFAIIEGNDIVGVKSSNGVFYLIATNDKGKSARLPLTVH